MLKVHLTRHAVERLFERFPKHKRFKPRIIANIVESVIRDGKVVEDGNEIKISTSNYTLCCNLSNDKLVVKTIMRTKEMGKPYRRKLTYGKKSEWKVIMVENMEKIERWCDQLKRLREVCSICGLTREQVEITWCKIHGFNVCFLCCPSVGGYSSACKGCNFDVVHVGIDTKLEGTIYY